MNNEISHENFIVIINEEKKYQKLKEIIRMMNSQKSDSEKINLIGESKTLMKLLNTVKLLITV